MDAQPRLPPGTNPTRHKGRRLQAGVMPGCNDVTNGSGAASFLVGFAAARNRPSDSRQRHASSWQGVRRFNKPKRANATMACPVTTKLSVSDSNNASTLQALPTPQVTVRNVRAKPATSGPRNPERALRKATPHQPTCSASQQCGRERELTSCHDVWAKRHDSGWHEARPNKYGAAKASGCQHHQPQKPNPAPLRTTSR